ncbi:MAG TPA: hypothetical protein VEU62_07055 [Bryobacterales bacterium]|nr:hypothetical protein [Bryobacterales bacterium]
MLDFKATPRRTNWEKDKPYTRQSNLYVELKPLEQIPVELRLKFRCKNNAACKGHASRLIAWEYMEAFRKFRKRYGSESEGLKKIKSHLEALFADSRKSSYALLGTHFRYPVWMIGQLYFLERDTPPRLF